ncbi:MAG: SelB C-terminal domain-containing protein [Spirochaetaceae bacterium]|nr:SelB C-terminal domain-containing protein [Spirochaetaceae bacterium]
MSEQKINRLEIACVEVKDNSEQNIGGKFVSILCENKSKIPFEETGSAILLPAGNRFTIRKCEKINENDYILTLKGLHRKDIRRGSVIVPSSYAVTSGKDAYVLLPSSKDRFDKGNYFIEGGVFKDYNHRNKKPSASITFYGRIGVVRFFYPFPLVVGARYYMSRENNQNLITPVTLVFPGLLGQTESSDLSARILKFGGRPSLLAIYSIILRIKQYVELPVYFKDEEFEGSVRCESYAIMSREYARIEGAILKRSSAVGGLEESKLLEQVKGDNQLIHVIVQELIKTSKIEKRDGYLMNITVDMRKSLSPIAKKILEDLEEENGEINLSNISNPLFSNTYKSLGRMKLLRILSGEIIISNVYYETLKARVLASCQVGETLHFLQVKDVLGLSRRVLIPLLEELDSEGYFEREGDSRIVLKVD